MQSRERVMRALRFQRPDRPPRDLWLLPGVEMSRQAEIARLTGRFSIDFAKPVFSYGPSERKRGTPFVAGSCVDEWDCLWEVGQTGVRGEVKGAPLADWSALDTYRLPYELLDNADVSRVEESCRHTDRFVLARTLIRPFERMQFLRGTENLMLDLACGPQALYRLRDLLHEFNLRELELWCATPVDGISFMDDWGSQRGLLIAPQTWRELFKPLYAEYCQVIHRAGKSSFFHSDGNIEAIIPELIECGVDALNSQLFCMDIETITRRHRGQITFWGEIDRQYVLPLGTTEEIRQAVHRVRRALDTGEGGVIAQCEWGNDVREEAVAAVFEAWEQSMDSLPGARGMLSSAKRASTHS